MNYVEHFLEIKSFLKKHKYIYELEVLKRYPNELNPFYLSVSKDLYELDLNELAHFESDIFFKENFSKDLKDLIKKISTLTKINKLKINETKLHQNLKRKLNPKKLHELSTLKTLFDQSSFDQVYDIGGGVGHLGHVFVANQNKRAQVFDMNEDFLSSGEEKMKRWLKEHSEKLSFTLKRVDEQFSLELKQNDLLAGLHSCGSLSVDIIKKYAQNNKGGLINFGCCYHQLNEDYNISKLSQKDPLHLTNNALHLATRGSSYASIDDLLKRKKVKYYRYGLHHLMLEKFNEGFITLGNGHKNDYNGIFSTYAKKYYPKASELSDDSLNQFYESVQDKIKENFYLDFIRGMFARVIELYLILDRVIYLEEHNIDVKMCEVFDRFLSPRNIGILVNFPKHQSL